MPIDVTKVIGAVTRELTEIEKDGATAKSVVATRTYDTEIEDLWDAITNAERLPRWFLPVTGDLRLGGRYALKGNAEGTILECVPPEHFAITWEFAGQTSWVNVTLSIVDAGRTALRLEHLAHVPPEFWDIYGPGATGVGWDGGLLGLELHLAGDTSVTPETVEAWAYTEEGRSFYRASSDAWGATAIAAGEDRAEALAAAERTRAFYTGDTPDLPDSSASTES